MSRLKALPQLEMPMNVMKHYFRQVHEARLNSWIASMGQGSVAKCFDEIKALSNKSSKKG